jgi:glucosyl-3-phosphoglycerate phosphatase
MRVLFLRHGESAHNVHTGEERLSEELGDVLTEHGRAQAAAAGEALRDRGVTRLLTSPMRRATETAEAVGEALGLAPDVIPYSFEHHREESFAEAMGRVREIKRHFEAGPADGLPLLVSHGILLRFFLLDSILGDGFTADLLPRIWNLRTYNCALSVFAHGEPGEPDESLGWSCVTWMERPWDLP